MCNSFEMQLIKKYQPIFDLKILKKKKEKIKKLGIKKQIYAIVLGAIYYFTILYIDIILSI